MTITLQIVEGPELGRKIFLQPGQHATIGRTEEADFCFPSNETMSHLHFALACDWSGCRVHDLDSRGGITLNGERIIDAELKEGDELQAGSAVFRTSLLDFDEASPDDDAGQSAKHESTAATAATPVTAPPVTDTPVSDTPVSDTPVSSVQAEPPGFIASTPGKICGNIHELQEAARALLTENQSIQEYVAVLEENQLFTDAVRFLAHALAKRDAVTWAADCVRIAAGDELSQADVHALEVTEAWGDEPSEDNRRAALAAAELLEHATPASWAAMGAFWSEGSMAPPEAPTIPAGPHLTAQAVAGSVMLAAVTKEPEKAPEKYRNFIQRGISKGELSTAH